MTPQLQQAIRLLQLPALELQAHIRELLESNVMLEPVEEGEGTGIFEAPEMPQTAAPAEAVPERQTENTVEVVDEGWGEQSVGTSDPNRPHSVSIGSSTRKWRKEFGPFPFSGV